MADQESVMRSSHPIKSARRSNRAVARALTLAVLAALLAGCETARETADTFPTDYRQRHPIVVQEGKRTLALFIGANRGGLTPTQRAEVLAFANTWRREATGGILIELPAGTVNAHAAHDSLREVRSILHAAGVPPRGVAVQPYQPRDPMKFATLKLIYPRITADAGPCGLWPHDIGVSEHAEHITNNPYWNLGCASQRALAAMTVEPADLVQPRGEASAYEPRRTVVLDKYRKGESTATTYPNANQGKISGVGQ
jgi:pilus assembly protein CpaD